MTEILYDRHEDEWQKCLDDEQRHKVALTWLENADTLDRWRHDRIYNLVKPVIEYDRKYSWLTVGDGRYGTDAHALMSMGANRVYCTDISDTLLKIGHEKGFIGDYSAQNAENLDFDDETFDFVFCKEAYHHFPRPHIALHEMLRVSRRGVVLVEPRDQKVDRATLNFILPLAKRLLGRGGDRHQHAFEPVGNYVFSISEREIEKIQLGMHRRCVAFNEINDFYQEGIEFIDLGTSDPAGKKKISRVKFLISLRDFLCRLGLVKSGLLASILFKSPPSPELVHLLQQKRWTVKTLPENPYI